MFLQCGPRRAGPEGGDAEMMKGRAVAWGVRAVAVVFVSAMLAACTPTGEDQNGLIEPEQERGPYAPFLG
jgi:hypothetical protein